MSSMNEFSSPCTDEPLAGNPRVHQEGREYYERNAKSANWFSHENGLTAPKPEARLRSDAARDNAMKNRGSMSDNMKGYANPAVERSVHPRAVKGEAEANAVGSKGGNMRNLMENYGNLEISPRPGAKVKGWEAEEYKEREQGSTKVLLNHYSTDPVPASEMPPAPRLGLGGEEVAEKHRGEQMGPLMRLEGNKTPREPKVGRLHQTSTGSGWDEIPPQHRMRPEGEGIAQKNSSDSINDIILQNNATPPQRKGVKVLKHMTESDSPRNTPHQRVRLDGIKNLERANNREEMSAIMHGSSTPSQARPASGKKVLPHLQRSELW
ncbi:uncharacterized protein LOC101847611 [Aplysia californica]|uniref:Uncharacterized protein LOC101847611 n=1 Tax=Aplysia californica TaxID=6500 RepID=A0ABM1A9I2_APLCA|nr:uncharacterized protein LOC101847611 [Aplysia californica]XP_005108193.1 uncharacterized protein LOC101847611 [Aplysia californica]XP_012943402.1 uncharacterized protein LOC101847611 [Aplysia californica]XP_035828253.1 uncharacterized protein LOC101847611 [Aplysia californica]XP_035828254.1 uncharacterized protein LOC101847611 [Aplysia californica]